MSVGQAASSMGQGAAGGAALGPWGALAGAGIGLGKYFIDQNARQNDMQRLAATQRYGVWTGMKDYVPMQHNNLAGDMLATGAAGASAVGNYQKAMSDLALNDAKTNYWKSLAAARE